MDGKGRKWMALLLSLVLIGGRAEQKAEGIRGKGESDMEVIEKIRCYCK